MKCDNCGHKNSPYAIICEKCDTPLKIEENKLLQEKYHNKGKHIDIEERELVQNHSDFNRTRKKVFRVTVLFLFLCLAFFLYFFTNYLLDKGSKEVLNTYSEYMKNSSLALFYFGDNEDLNLLCEKYSNNYGFDYLNIQRNKISKQSRRKMQEELNIYNITSTLVIVKNGVPITSITHISEGESLLKFLQSNELVPHQLEDTSKELESFKESFSSQNPVLLYLPTTYTEEVDKTSKTLSSIAGQYSLEYYEVKGFYLSNKQLMKIMSQLGYSEIQKDLILYIVDGEVVKAIEDTQRSNYFKLLSSYGIIDTSSANYLIKVSGKKFLELIADDKNKQVILIGSNNCASCDRVMPILGQIANQHHIIIYYYNATNSWDVVSSKIKDLGLESGLTNTPFLMIVEKKKILDYVVGLATRDLYLEKLTEVGVIR